MFVVAAVALLLFCLVFLRYASTFEEYREYFFLYQGSVSGLDRGSKVAFNGVPIGKVKEIGFTPQDLSRIRVVLQISTPDEVLPILDDTRVSLKYVSIITGTLYVELKGGKGNTRHDPATPIPVEVSLLDDLEKKLDRLDDRLNEILVQVKDLLRDENREKVRQFLADAQEAASHLKVVASNARRVSDNLDRTLTLVHDILKENRQPIRDSVAEAAKALQSARVLLAQVEEQRTVEAATQAIQNAGQTAETLTRSAQDITQAAQSLARSAEHSLAEIDKLLPPIQREAVETLAQARRTLQAGDEKIQEVTQDVHRITDAAESLALKAETAFESADRLITHADALVGDASTDVRNTLDQIRQASENMDQLARSLHDLVVTKTPAVAKILDNLKDTSNELKEFAEVIRRQPSTLIGRRQKDERRLDE